MDTEWSSFNGHWVSIVVSTGFQLIKCPLNGHWVNPHSVYILPMSTQWTLSIDTQWTSIEMDIQCPFFNVHSVYICLMSIGCPSSLSISARGHWMSTEHWMDIECPFKFYGLLWWGLKRHVKSVIRYSEVFIIVFFFPASLIYI